MTNAWVARRGASGTPCGCPDSRHRVAAALHRAYIVNDLIPRVGFRVGLTVRRLSRERLCARTSIPDAMRARPAARSA